MQSLGTRLREEVRARVSLGVNLLRISYPALTARWGTLGAREVKNNILHLQKGARLTRVKALLKLTCTKALVVGPRSIHPGN